MASICLALAFNTPAAADGPALAHVTVFEHTITLTAEGEMVVWDDAALHLHFAQLHLGFPIPPEVRLTLIEGNTGWRVESLDLQSFGQPLILDPTTAQVVSATGEGRDLQVEIAIDGLTPGPLGAPEPTPVTIEVSLRSP